jgi:monoamine oxidase
LVHGLLVRRPVGEQVDISGRSFEKSGWDIIVIGAGIAGLTAARELARAGARVAVLEGRGRPGGRILSVRPETNSAPVELGAEFVHGKPPELLALARDAGIELEPVAGRHFELSGGEVRPAKELDDILGELERAQPSEGESALELARMRGFDSEHARWFQHFVEGFHGGPSDRVSARSIVRQTATTETQARSRQGYGALVDFLSAELVNAGAGLALGCRVENVAVTAQGVVVRDGLREYRADACIVAVPLAMFQAPPELGGIELEPPPPEVLLAARRFESGLALRVTLRLVEPVPFQAALPAGAFVHALDEDFPTWWAGSDPSEPRLVAWCGGPRCAKIAGDRRAGAAALATFARLLGKTLPETRALVRDVYVHDFGVDQFSRGAYPYELAAGDSDVELPIFAGSPPLLVVGDFFDADEVGTVAAAVKSGTAAARTLLGRRHAAAE